MIQASCPVDGSRRALAWVGFPRVRPQIYDRGVEDEVDHKMKARRATIGLRCGLHAISDIEPLGHEGLVDPGNVLAAVMQVDVDGFLAVEDKAQLVVAALVGDLASLRIGLDELRALDALPDDLPARQTLMDDDSAGVEGQALPEGADQVEKDAQASEAEMRSEHGRAEHRVADEAEIGQRYASELGRAEQDDPGVIRSDLTALADIDGVVEPARTAPHIGIGAVQDALAVLHDGSPGPVAPWKIDAHDRNISLRGRISPGRDKPDESSLCFAWSKSSLMRAALAVPGLATIGMRAGFRV